jgi:hypothetical protein
MYIYWLPRKKTNLKSEIETTQKVKQEKQWC